MNAVGGKKILLVEDEALIGMSEAMSLKNYGYDVTHVMDGQKAIRYINNGGKDTQLILMDIDLGQEMDGPEAAKIIMLDHDIPVLFLSSHTERGIVEKTENITSYGYVVKNSDMAVLDASIKMAFKLHDALRTLKNQNTEIRRKDEKLRFSEKRYRRLFESAKDGILILDAVDGRIIDVNQYLIDMLGYSKEEFLDRNIWNISAFKSIDYSKQLFKELQEKEYVRYLDLPLETFNGTLIHVEFVSNVYLVDTEKVIQCNIRDIADRRRSEKKLNENIDQKEALLREIQHRTKNSFNMITSLLQLRAGVSQSEETKSTLEELALRVNSISDLYALLYETKSFFEVHLDVYCEKVIASMRNIAKYIVIEKSIAPITVSAKNAATIGMILVEILTNAIKYAFPESDKGTIKISLDRVDHRIRLSIEDDGIGLPANFELAKIKSLGLHLVNLMVDQLNGTVSITSNNGTKVLIEWHD